MTAGVVLAAGAGRRFGGVKQLASLGGEPLVRRACRTALDAALDPVLVVLGAHADAVAAAIRDLPVRALYHAAWRRGMGGSLAAAIAALAPDPAIAAAAVLLADQPWIPAGHVRALCARRAAADAPVAATRAGDVVGAPAVFARALFPALAALTGDRGARALIAAHADAIAIRLEAAASDVDTRADHLAAQAAVVGPTRPVAPTDDTRLGVSSKPGRQQRREPLR